MRPQPQLAAVLAKLTQAVAALAGAAGVATPTTPAPPSPPGTPPPTPSPASPSPPSPSATPNWQRALGALLAGMVPGSTGLSRVLGRNPVAAGMLGAGLFHSPTARRLTTAALGLRLATRTGRAKLSKGVRVAARSLGAGKKFAARLGRGAAAAGAVGGIVGAAVAATKAVGGMAEAALEAQRKLAQVSGDIAAIFAERHVRDVFRGQAQGARIAGTTAELARAEADFKDALEPIESLWINIKNSILAPTLDILTNLLKPVTFIAEKVNELVGKAPEKNDLAEALKDVADAAEKARALKAPAFLRPEIPAGLHRP